MGQWDTHVANGATYTLSYDVVTDFEPVAISMSKRASADNVASRLPTRRRNSTLVSSNPFLILAKKAVPANDLQGLIAWLGEPR